MVTPIRKAILPVAGLGTRFLPATKAVPKEMLTVVDRPVVQHVVDEARAAGIEHIVFVTGRNKGVIEDHFDRQYELEDTLLERGKSQMLEMLRQETMGPGATSFTRQQLPLGLGHAVWCARDIIGNEPFALLLPDMLHKPTNGKGCLAQMVDAYAKTGGNHIAVYEVPPEQTDQYGIVGLGTEVADGVHKIASMVEKPKKDVAPSNLAISGRYILQPEIFELLATQERGAGNEIQLTDSMLKLAQRQDFYSVTFDGAIYDCGSKLGFLMANVAYALANPEISDTFRPELDALLAKN
ncbi:UTP--glucose-1-phosphate uridylyltransferase [Starkeya nomas]|uniref:UTP--glucose-1-phosphate uridylyltransferase n=2 Tax=Xanthobacteraceae TaxID=335928 RepID=A0A5S9PCY2_9HYPH|nr:MULTISPECIES: UTP--glucose-1-phosphate uridylyltransferase GalU [Xanthobacteraceae]TSJ60646.1 UTP--glucose-1-phosphate uridylyltransferase GalU [Ancylobacter moscoviensis]CAA0101615.1 UTP--glucose-1-phosphate uridylyltransferase [Starkeya nomas]